MKLSYLWAKFVKKARGSAIRGCEIHPTSKVEAGSQVVDTKFDRHSFCGYDCAIQSCDIGSFTSIANGVVIGGGRHPMEWVGMSPVFYEGRDSVQTKFSEHVREPVQRTSIGHDVWIGERALVRQGVSIGNGAVVGMGSVVTRDVADYSIVGGNPAREIRRRFDDEVIARLQELRWWEWTDEELEEHAGTFVDPGALLDKLARR